ncbi:MAG: GntR family transcriptional regulator [Oscillospiraceae bacterium]|nr:GntR family transcriptional regulator [Oscillospiraceae bacterium]
MDIIISNSGERAIYEQIYDRIKELILTGELPPDEPLPSIRDLAKDLRISVITTKRAYNELERDGFIATIPGKGSFAKRQDNALVREQYLRTIEEHLSESFRLARLGKISDEEMDELYALAKEDTV